VTVDIVVDGCGGGNDGAQVWLLAGQMFGALAARAGEGSRTLAI